jgi:hypothetical protein
MVHPPWKVLKRQKMRNGFYANESTWVKSPAADGQDAASKGLKSQHIKHQRYRRRKNDKTRV